MTVNQRSTGIGLARAGVSFILLKDFIMYLYYAEDFFGSKGIVSFSHYVTWLHRNHMIWLQLPFNNPAFTFLFLTCGCLLTICFFSDIYPTVAGIILSLILVELKLRNVYILDGADNVVEVVLPFLAIAKGKSVLRFNIPQIWLHNPVNRAYLRVIRIIATYGVLIQVCFVYFFTVIAKLHEPIWRNGTALYYSLSNLEFSATRYNALLANNSLIVYSLTIFTILWEASFPFAVWFRRFRLPFLILSASMHIGILVLLRIDNYSVLMIILYLSFITNSEYEGIVAFFRRKRFLVKMAGVANLPVKGG